MSTLNNIAVKNAQGNFRSAIKQTSQPRRSIASGYVSAVQSDSAGKLTTATVRTSNGGTVRAYVQPGMDVYVGMTVNMENFGSPSLASWVVSGWSALPAGTSGGVITNINGVIVGMFESIWVIDEGYIMAGGLLDEDNNPTGSRVYMDQTGIFGYGPYGDDLPIFGLYTRDTTDHQAGDLTLGYAEGGHVEISPEDRSFSIWNNEDLVMMFDPELGNRITKNLWVGDDIGPQVGIGKWVIDDEEVSAIVARNAGSGDANQIGNEPRFMLAAGPTKTTLSVGDPDHSSSYIFYDSSENGNDGELTVDAIIRAKQLNVYGAGVVAEGGYISAVAGGTSLAGIYLRPKYLEGIGNGGDRTFLLAAATVTLPKNPADPTVGNDTWQGGEGFVGRRMYRHFRWAGDMTGMYMGDDPRIYFDSNGNVVMKGWLDAWDHEVTVGRDGQGIEITTPSGDIDGVKKLVTYINNSNDRQFLAGMWASLDTTLSEASETLVDRINLTLGTFSYPWNETYRSNVRILSNAGPDRQAQVRLQAAGDNGQTAQAILDLWSLRGGDGNHSRIDLNSGTVRLFSLDSEPTATTGMSLNNGEISYPDGTSWDPFSYISGQYFVARLGGEWVPFAQEVGTEWRWGDLTTNYAKFDTAGSLSFVGSAREWPRWSTETQNTTSFNVTKTVTRVNVSGGAFTGTLPTAVGSTGTIYAIYKIDSSANAVTIACTGGETINGAATLDLESQWDGVVVVSNGTNWETLAKPGGASVPGSGLTHPEVMARGIFGGAF